MEEKKYKSGTGFLPPKLYNYYKQPIHLTKDERSSGVYAWAVMLLFVIAYDAYAIKTKRAETLTRAFWRLTEKGILRHVPLLIWSAISLHLVLEKDVRKKKFGIIK
jgi:hypothetical protein